MGSVHKTVYFSGTPSNDSQRAYLQKKSFVHVTGIQVVLQGLAYHIGERLRPEEYGYWNTHKDLTVIVTTGGEVWVRGSCYELNQEEEQLFCPHGKGGFVPFTHGEFGSPTDILRRIMDPEYALHEPLD